MLGQDLLDERVARDVLGWAAPAGAGADDAAVFREAEAPAALFRLGLGCAGTWLGGSTRGGSEVDFLQLAQGCRIAG